MKPQNIQVPLCVVVLLCLECWQNARAQDLPLVSREIPQRPIQLHSQDGANFFSGDYKYAIPLPLPVAKGIRPTLSLVYNSSLDRSGVGKGWAIDGIPHVKRSLRHGIPSYNDPGELPEDEFQYQVGTTNGFLVKSTGGPYYQPKSDDGSMLRLYYLPHEHIWKVYDKNGTVWVLGHFDSNPSGDRIFGWYVTEIEDSDGNKIIFSYDPAQPDLPTTIRWDIDAFERRIVARSY
jgi:Salmonella virulence plasmid 65kDa B protein